MFIRSMVYHEIDHHAYTALAASVSKLYEIAESSIARIDPIVVADIISAVTPRRGLERHKPDCRDTETMEIIQTPYQAFEITNAVSIGIHVRRYGQAVDDGVLVPKIVDQSGFRRNGVPRPFVVFK